MKKKQVPNERTGITPVLSFFFNKMAFQPNFFTKKFFHPFFSPFWQFYIFFNYLAVLHLGFSPKSFFTVLAVLQFGLSPKKIFTKNIFTIFFSPKFFRRFGCSPFFSPKKIFTKNIFTQKIFT